MWLYRLAQGLRPVLRLYWDLRLEGAVDALPREGPLIVVANHSSFLDPWLLGAVFPRPLHYLITREWYDRSPLWRAFFRAWGVIPVQRDPQATVDEVARVVERGEVVGVFPEGRISHDGRMQRFRSGVVYLAARTGAPVLPVGLAGPYEILPRHRRWPRRGRVVARVGLPLRFAGSPEARPSRQAVRAFREALFRAVASLADAPAPEAGAEGETRTPTGLHPLDPESSASTSSATSARDRVPG